MVKPLVANESHTKRSDGTSVSEYVERFFLVEPEGNIAAHPVITYTECLEVY